MTSVELKAALEDLCVFGCY